MGQKIASHVCHFLSQDVGAAIVEFHSYSWLIMKHYCDTFCKHAKVCRYWSHFCKFNLVNKGTLSKHGCGWDILASFLVTVLSTEEV